MDRHIGWNSDVDTVYIFFQIWCMIIYFVIKRISIYNLDFHKLTVIHFWLRIALSSDIAGIFFWYIFFFFVIWSSWFWYMASGFHLFLKSQNMSKTDHQNGPCDQMTNSWTCTFNIFCRHFFNRTTIPWLSYSVIVDQKFCVVLDFDILSEFSHLPSWNTNGFLKLRKKILDY